MHAMRRHTAWRSGSNAQQSCVPATAPRTKVSKQQSSKATSVRLSFCLFFGGGVGGVPKTLQRPSKDPPKNEGMRYWPFSVDQIEIYEFCKVFGGSLEGLWRVFGGSLEGLWYPFGGSLEGASNESFEGTASGLCFRRKT